MFFNNDGIGASRRDLNGTDAIETKRAKSGDGKRRAPGTTRLRMETLETRSLLSAVSPFANVDDVQNLALATESFYAAKELEPETLAPIAVGCFSCPGYSEPDAKSTGVEEYPAFKDTIDQLLTGAGQNLDALSQDFVFNLSSCPESTYTIYLDFDGSVYSGSSWNNGAEIVTPAYDVDGDEGSFSNQELRNIYEIWYRVSEDYIPFNVNVTTKQPTSAQLMKNGANDVEYGIRAAIGGSCYDWYYAWANETCGGVAYVGSFNWSTDTPCYIFPKNVSGPKSVAACITHEVGHTLGLSHDGTSQVEYYNGANGWAPHMGTGYQGDITQWSKGEYVDASNHEDDLAILTTQNGFGYRADDHGDIINAATPLTFAVEGTLASGIIERSTDVDFFSFDLSGEETTITVGGVDTVTNLDALVNLYDELGRLIETYDPLDTFYASIDASTLAPGRYYLGVAGTGSCVGGELHYTDYASLGAYTISTSPGDDQLDPFEPNNSFSNAYDLGFLSGTNAFDNVYIAASDSYDYYQFTIGTTGDENSFVRVNYERDPDRHCLYLGVYDSDQTQLDYRYVLNVSEETVSLANRPAGTYYVKFESTTTKRSTNPIRIP